MTTDAPPQERQRLRFATADYSLSLTLVVAGAFLLAVAVRYALALQIATPWIMADELIYSEMAKNFADHGEFLLRDTPSALNNVAYPILIAPAWLLGSVESAYALAKLINVVLMSSTSVLVYVWARRLASPTLALLPAGLVLVMPSLLYTGMLMTENAFLPAFVGSCFAIALALERPTLLRQGAALGAIALTCVIRPQALVLIPIYVGALALKLAFDLRAPGGGRGLRFVGRELVRFVPTAATLLVLAVGYVVVKSIQGQGLETGLGAYGGVVKVHYDRAYAAQWVLDHFAEIGLAVAVVPVSALIVLFGMSWLGWVSTPAERAFVAVASPAFVLLVLQVGVYASRFSVRVEERNMFGVAPLLFLALTLWLARGLPRPWLLAAVAGLAPPVLLYFLNLEELVNIGILSDTFSLIPMQRLAGLFDGDLVATEAAMHLGALGAGLAFILLPRRLAAVLLPALVAGTLIAFSYIVFGSIRDHSDRTLALTSVEQPSWIDERLDGARAGYLFGATPDYFGEAQVMWQTEFWNRSVGTVYSLGPPDPGLTTSTARFDSLTGRVVTGDAVEHVVAPTTVEFVGKLLDRQEWLALTRVDPPMRLATHLGGVWPDSWMGDFAAFTHYASPSSRGRIDVRISREGWGGPSPPGRVSIKVGVLGSQSGAPAISRVVASRKWTVRSGRARSFTLPTPAAPYRLEIRIAPTFSPVDFAKQDTRQLGAQVKISGASAWTG